MKERLDSLLVKRGFVTSREKARALIMEGKVIVNGNVLTKPGTMIEGHAAVSLRADIPYVSRGGLKLKSALEHFNIDLKGKIAMDVGAGTGGFTDCMLKMGVKKVYCIDVGYGQFDWNLRNNPQVILLEKTNIRYLERSKIPDEIDISTVDVSFISLRKVIPRLIEFLKPDGEIIALIKPQFEAGRREVGKGGIVRKEEIRQMVVNSIKEAMEELGLYTVGIIQSPISGQKGNIEYLIYLVRKKESLLYKNYN